MGKFVKGLAVAENNNTIKNTIDIIMRFVL